MPFQARRGAITKDQFSSLSQERDSLYVEDLNLSLDNEHLTIVGKHGKRRTILLDDPHLVQQLRAKVGYFKMGQLSSLVISAVRPVLEWSRNIIPFFHDRMERQSKEAGKK